MGLALAIISLVVFVLQLHLLLAMNKGMNPLELERHQKMPHWFEYQPLDPFRSVRISCFHCLEYSIILSW